MFVAALFKKQGMALHIHEVGVSTINWFPFGDGMCRLQMGEIYS
jgi:hypothetical protein